MPISHSRKNKKEGFTLIEMVVSLAIFSVVAVIALGALMRIISANQKAQAIQAAVTNVNFALESMSRELRLATKLTPSSGTIDSIYFISAIGTENCHAYKFSLDGSTYLLQKAEKSIDPDTENCDSLEFTGLNDFINITSSNITLTSGSFNVAGDPYRLISFQLSGFAGDKEKVKTYFDVSTAVSSRVQ
ncbi:MAG: type II secretion system protein [Patescibacteria group bacterium]